MWLDFWPAYFNEKIISTSILTLQLSLEQLNYCLENFSLFNAMKNATKINLEMFSSNSIRLKRERLLKDVNSNLLIEPNILDVSSLGSEPDLLEFFIEVITFWKGFSF